MLDSQQVNQFMGETYRLLREKMPAMQAFHIRNSIKCAYRAENSDQINYCLAKIEEKLLKVFINDLEKIQQIKALFLTAPRLPDFDEKEEDIFKFEL